MKFLIVFVCALAGASAGLLATAPVLTEPQHLPVIGPNGVPIDTAAVQEARAAHFSHQIEAHLRNGDIPVVGQVGPVVADLHHLAKRGIAVPVQSVYAPHVVAPVVVPHSPVVTHSALLHPAPVAVSPVHHHLFKRGIYAAPPVVAYSTHVATPVIAHAPVVSHSPVVAHPPLVAHSPPVVVSPVHHLYKRGIYAAPPPVAYSSHLTAPVIGHAPVVAHPTYTAPLTVHPVHHLFKRGIYTAAPVAAPLTYASPLHAPLLAPHAPVLAHQTYAAPLAVPAFHTF